MQLAAYRNLLTVDGGQSFSVDPLQYHQVMESLNFGISRIFGKSDPGVALQIVMKSCSGDALAAICGCAAVPDKAIALKQALEILPRLFDGQRKVIGGLVDRVCEGRPVHGDVKELHSFLIDMMTCQYVLANNGSGSQLDFIAITQEVCRRLPFKLCEKVGEVAFRRCEGNVLYVTYIIFM